MKINMGKYFDFENRKASPEDVLWSATSFPFSAADKIIFELIDLSKRSNRDPDLAMRLVDEENERIMGEKRLGNGVDLHLDESDND